MLLLIGSKHGFFEACSWLVGEMEQWQSLLVLCLAPVHIILLSFYLSIFLWVSIIMQKLSALELDLVSGGHVIIIVEAPGHYVADHRDIDMLGRDIVANNGNIATNAWSDYSHPN